VNRGEIVMGAAMALLGLGWLLLALDLPYMGEFAPGSGFLPIWLSGALLVLAVAFVIKRLRAGAWSNTAVDPYAPPLLWQRPAAIAAGLSVCVAVIESLGFCVTVTLYLAFLLRVIERRTWTVTLGVSVGTAGVLWALFGAWLHVPLPKGPWGF
jgi:putative tricarboxylic transport membrane protein